MLGSLNLRGPMREHLYPYSALQAAPDLPTPGICVGTPLTDYLKSFVSWTWDQDIDANGLPRRESLAATGSPRANCFSSRGKLLQSSASRRTTTAEITPLNGKDLYKWLGDLNIFSRREWWYLIDDSAAFLLVTEQEKALQLEPSWKRPQ